MRIVYVLTSLGIGGAERQTLLLASRMQQRGHAVALLILKGRQAEEWPATAPPVYLGLKKSPRSLFSAFRRAKGFLEGYGADVVQSHGFHGNLFARLLLVLDSVPVVSTLHNVYEGGWARMLAYRLTDALSWRTIAVSDEVRRRFIRKRSVAAGNCFVVRNAVEIAEWVPDGQRRRSIRQELGVGECFLWLATGRLAKAKDYPNLLRAFAGVQHHRAGARLWIAGAGQWDGLRELARSLGIGEAVRWLGLRRDMSALMDAADGYVLSSAWEGMPLALMEAMAMAKPVVATNVGGINELVAECGCLVPPADPVALAEAMLRMMACGQEEREVFGRAARERILAHFSMETRASEWEQIYRSVQ